MTDRYDVSDLRGGQFEPGSNDQILRNKLGITSVEDMNIAETAALASATEEFVHRFDAQHRFTADDIPATVAAALAETHAELVLIHPFREGNGRISRLLCVLMALQAGLPFLDFGVMAGDRKSEYFSAVQQGLDRDYSKMTSIFIEIIRNTTSQV